MDRSALQKDKRLAELKKEVNRRGFDRHASVLKDISELSPELQSSALVQFAAYEPMQTIVAFPPQIQRGWSYVPRQALLFTPTGVIHVLASIWPGEEPQVSYIKGCDLISLRVTLVLLYGFIEIVARGNDAPTRLSVEFNTVAWPYLSMPMRQLLFMSRTGPIMAVNGLVHASTLQQLLEDLPLKFSNGVEIYGRLPGQAIEALAFQPGVWKRWLYLLRRNMLANTLLMLTTDFLVIIQEELKVEQGWVLMYLPRECVVEIQNRPRDQWNELTICLRRRSQTAAQTVLLGNKAVQIWHRQWTQQGGSWRQLASESL